MGSVVGVSIFKYKEIGDLSIINIAELVGIKSKTDILKLSRQVLN